MVVKGKLVSGKDRCSECVLRGRKRFVFLQAEDGIRSAQESRGLGDVYKRQPLRFYFHWSWYIDRFSFVLFFFLLQKYFLCRQM